MVRTDTLELAVRCGPAGIRITPGWACMKPILPFVWAIESDGHHCRLAFEKHEWEMRYEDPKILSQIDQYVRLTHEPKLPPTVRFRVTFFHFISCPPWYIQNS
jgi:hypothetical protein